MNILRLGLLGLTLVTCSFVGMAQACPFCTAQKQTFAEEIAVTDVVAFARLKQAAGFQAQSSDADKLPESVFQVSELLKGDSWVQAGTDVKTYYFGKPDQEKIYLIMGTDPPSINWSTPLALSQRAYGYVKRVAKLPKESSTRLKYFLDYLEDPDPMLKQDAYDEFAKAPYQAVIDLKSELDRQQLLDWIIDPDVQLSQRRLYFTLLSVCGEKADADLLEALMTSPDREKRAGLDAMINCYLSLKGESGLPLVNKTFLGNDQAEYADTYAAIMAIRFHGSEMDDVPREKLLESLRLVLSRPDLADLVIPDLARWEDWSVIPDLVRLFKRADKDSNWVRVPIINYLRACPLPVGAKTIEQLSQIDPDAVKRASSFFPFAQAAGASRKDKEAGQDASDASVPPPSIPPDVDEPAGAGKKPG